VPICKLHENQVLIFNKAGRLENQVLIFNKAGRLIREKIRLNNITIECAQQGMLIPPWHLIPFLIYSEVRERPFSDLYFL
jgi:hypothetical protein